MTEPADRFPTHDAVMTWLGCGRCHGPTTKHVRVLDGVTWTTWVCENDACEIGAVGTFADVGMLDLGIIRDPELDRRNDFAMFAEGWIGIEQLGERSGPADIE